MRSRAPRTIVGIWLSAMLALVACGDEPPSVGIVGGGFIFNYRLAEAHYGFVAEVGGAVPTDAALEATFEDPAGGPPIVLRKPHQPGRQRVKFETPPLAGIEADRPYRVTVRLIAADGTELAAAERAFTSKLAQDVLPSQPLTVGPGYHTPPVAGRD